MQVLVDFGGALTPALAHDKLVQRVALGRRDVHQHAAVVQYYSLDGVVDEEIEEAQGLPIRLEGGQGHRRVAVWSGIGDQDLDPEGRVVYEGLVDARIVFVRHCTKGRIRLAQHIEEGGGLLVLADRKRDRMELRYVKIPRLQGRTGQSDAEQPRISLKRHGADDAGSQAEDAGRGKAL